MLSSNFVVIELLTLFFPACFQIFLIFLSLPSLLTTHPWLPMQSLLSFETCCNETYWHNIILLAAFHKSCTKLWHSWTMSSVKAYFLLSLLSTLQMYGCIGVYKCNLFCYFKQLTASLQSYHVVDSEILIMKMNKIIFIRFIQCCFISVCVFLCDSYFLPLFSNMFIKLWFNDNRFSWFQEYSCLHGRLNNRQAMLWMGHTLWIFHVAARIYITS